MKIRKIVLSFTVLSAGVLLLYYADACSAAALDALSDCIRQVIPSLFPYMVLSSMILSLGLTAFIERLIPMQVFRLPSCTASVFLTGILCGFPVGASGTASLVSCGKISRSEGAKLTAISSQVSPAFLIGAVGSVWGSKLFGLYLFASGIVFALLCGILLRFSHTEESSSSHPVIPTQSAVSAFCRAVTDAASSCLAVTGFIVFFRVLSTLAAMLLPPLESVFALLFEFSSGAVHGARAGGPVGVCMTGFAVGFSGFSVLAQILHYTSPLKISFAPIFFVKLAQGLFTAAAALLFYLHIPMQPASDALSSAVLLSIPDVILPIVLLLILHFAGQFLLPANKFSYRT